jgi:hypothetical protein
MLLSVSTFVIHSFLTQQLITVVGFRSGLHRRLSISPIALFIYVMQRLAVPLTTVVLDFCFLVAAFTRQLLLNMEQQTIFHPVVALFLLMRATSSTVTTIRKSVVGGLLQMISVLIPITINSIFRSVH